MDKTEMTELLKKVADGSVSPEEATLKLKMQPFMEIGEFAKVDFHRGIRQGVPEVIYGEGKTREHILSIAKAMLENGQKTALVTRMNKEAADYVGAQLPLEYNPMSRTGIIGERPEPTGKGRIVVATGGTSDIPVAEEAAVTAEVPGHRSADERWLRRIPRRHCGAAEYAQLLRERRLGREHRQWLRRGLHGQHDKSP